VKAQPAKSKAAAKALKPATKAKPAAKAAAQPAKKTAGKVATKAVGKAPAKVAAKVAPKAASKATAKAPPKKASAKPVIKSKSAPASQAKAVPKVAAKPAAKSAVAAKEAARKPVPVPPKATPVSKSAAAPAKTVKPPAVADKTVPAQPARTAASAPATAGADPMTPVPTKTPRPSSRLAQITVPSMAQAVASTAAKASYSQTMPATLIVPPPPAAAKKDPKLANNWKTKSAEQLTDAEVLAMPDSEYMNEKQTAFFRLKLVQLKRDMLANAGETTEHLREDTVVVPDPADRATIEEEHALELRTRDRERKLLKKIEQSIVRLDAGDYGYCDETGEPIGVGRLLARPTATLSLEAQQRRELKQKMFGD
jgi:DnaK suppressor protein